MYTYEQKKTHATNVRAWGMQMNNGFGKHANNLAPETYFNTNFPCQWGWECTHGPQCGGIHPIGSRGMLAYQAEHHMSADAFVECFPCSGPKNGLYNDEEMEGYWEDGEWIEVGIKQYSTEELEKQGRKVAQARKEILSDTSKDVTVAPTSRWGSTTASRVVPDVGQDMAPSRGMGSTQGIGEPKTEEDQLVAAVAAQSLLHTELASVKKELEATKKDLEESNEARSKQTKLKKQEAGAFKDAMAAKDAEIEGLTTALTTAQNKNATLTERCVAAQKLANKACEAAEQAVDTLEKISTVYVDKIVEAPVEEVFDDLKWESELLLERLDDYIDESVERIAEEENLTLMSRMALWCDEELFELKEDVRELKEDYDTFMWLAKMEKKDASTKIQAAMRGFLVRKAKAEKEAASKLQVALLYPTAWSVFKTNNPTIKVENEAYAAQQRGFFGQYWTITAALIEEQGQTGPTSTEETDIQRLISMVSGLTARLASLEAEVSALKAERAAGNGQ